MFDFCINILSIFTVSSSVTSHALFWSPLLMAVYLYDSHIDITVIKCKGLELENNRFANNSLFLDLTCSDAQFWIAL
jgi:hypothetical protein